jgi:sugar phosphate isomerase/epimerase
MKTISRRKFTQFAAAGAGSLFAACSPSPEPETTAPPEKAAAPAMINSTFQGVRIGCQSYSFRDRPVDQVIAAMAEIGIGECELWSAHLERMGGDSMTSEMTREQLRDWRLTVPLNEIEAVGRRFRDAGVRVYAFNYSFKDDFTDPEIERGFEMAKALGSEVLTASSNVTTANRIDPFAQKYGMRVGMHNHSRIEPNEFATPDDFAAAKEGNSNHIAINLDIGHFTAANFDPLAYLSEHHADIVTLHIKDRKRDQGDNVPFGEGDTKITEALHLLRDNKYDIPANIEYEYKGADTVAEVRKCFEYCKAALGA